MISARDKTGKNTVRGKMYRLLLQMFLPIAGIFIIIFAMILTRNLMYASVSGNIVKASGFNQNFKIEISEEGKCKKITEGNKVHEYTVDQLREHNCLLVQNYGPQRRMAEEQLLEAIAKTCENYDNVMLMDAVTIFSTPSHKFIVIESGDNAHAESIWSNRTPKWSCTSNILETVNFIKKKTNVDLSEQYAEKIQNLIAEAEKKDAETLKESLRQNEIQLRREKIEKLTQQFKNDPVKLAVLSKAAADLSALED